LVSQAGKELPASGKVKAVLTKQLRHFEKNAAQMRHAEFREQKSFVGSGVVEAACRTVIGERLKQSGMRWSVQGLTPSSPCVAALCPDASRISRFLGASAPTFIASTRLTFRKR
jgi:hypothetical protein